MYILYVDFGKLLARRTPAPASMEEEMTQIIYALRKDNIDHRAWLTQSMADTEHG